MVLVEDIWPEWRGESVIGAGGSGTVWRARRAGRRSGELSAVKVIELRMDADEYASLRDLGMDEGSLSTLVDERAEALLREIDAMRMLRGLGHVVEIEDYRLVELPEGDGVAIGLRMELLEPVPAYFRRVGLPCEQEAARLGICICAALAACHERGIIHRDVKPPNLFHAPDGGYKLGDFGVARMLEQETVRTMTRTGTSLYMAPELYFGRRYGADVDTYALGITLYRLLNEGRLPFVPLPPLVATEGDIERAECRRLSGEELPDPANADEELGCIVRRACAHDPSRRYESAADMGEALAAWLRRHPGEGGRDASLKDDGGRDATDARLPADKASLTRRAAILGGALLAAAAFAGIPLAMGPLSSGSRSAARFSKVAAGDYHSVGLREDGTLAACGANSSGQCELSSWQGVVDIAAGSSHTVAACADGSAVACGNDASGQCGVLSWANVRAVAAGSRHTLGLQADGTVLAAGDDAAGACDVDDWADVVAISAGRSHSVGLRSDGTVVASGNNDAGQCEVASWSGVVAIAAGGSSTLGLRADGSVLAAGSWVLGDSMALEELAGSTTLASGDWGAAGTRADGTVSMVGSPFGEDVARSTSLWSGMAALAMGERHMLGLRRDGTVEAAGSNHYGQCDVDTW